MAAGFGGIVALSRLDVDNQPSPLYLLTEAKGDLLELSAFDGTDSWAGKLTRGQLREMAAKVCTLVTTSCYAVYAIIFTSVNDRTCGAGVNRRGQVQGRNTEGTDTPATWNPKLCLQHSEEGWGAGADMEEAHPHR